jgi:ABC-type sugar transport system permease subunit
MIRIASFLHEIGGISRASLVCQTTDGMATFAWPLGPDDCSNLFNQNKAARNTPNSVLFFIFALHTVYASLFISRSRQDMDVAFFYLENAERCISNAAPEPRARPEDLHRLPGKKQLHEIFRTNVTSVVGRTITTGLLAGAVFALLGRNVLPS